MTEREGLRADRQRQIDNAQEERLDEIKLAKEAVEQGIQEPGEMHPMEHLAEMVEKHNVKTRAEEASTKAWLAKIDTAERNAKTLLFGKRSSKKAEARAKQRAKKIAKAKVKAREIEGKRIVITEAAAAAANAAAIALKNDAEASEQERIQKERKVKEDKALAQEADVKHEAAAKKAIDDQRRRAEADAKEAAEKAILQQKIAAGEMKEKKESDAKAAEANEKEEVKVKAKETAEKQESKQKMENIQKLQLQAKKEAHEKARVVQSGKEAAKKAAESRALIEAIGEAEDAKRPAKALQPMQRTVTDTSITMDLQTSQYTPQDEIDLLELQWSRFIDPQFWTSVPVEVNATESQEGGIVTVTSLWPYQMYQFRSRAHNSNGWGNWSDATESVRTNSRRWNCSTNADMGADVQTSGGVCAEFVTVKAQPDYLNAGGGISGAIVTEGDSLFGTFVSTKSATLNDGWAPFSKECAKEFASDMALWASKKYNEATNQPASCQEMEPTSLQVLSTINKLKTAAEEQQKDFMQQVESSRETAVALGKAVVVFEDTKVPSATPVNGTDVALWTALRKKMIGTLAELNTMSKTVNAVYTDLKQARSGWEKEGLGVNMTRAWNCSTDASVTAEFKALSEPCSPTLVYTALPDGPELSSQCRAEFIQWSMQRSSEALGMLSEKLQPCNSVDAISSNVSVIVNQVEAATVLKASGPLEKALVAQKDVVAGSFVGLPVSWVRLLANLIRCL